jgi:hypothetical protein
MSAAIANSDLSPGTFTRVEVEMAHTPPASALGATIDATFSVNKAAHDRRGTHYPSTQYDTALPRLAL